MHVMSVCPEKMIVSPASSPKLLVNTTLTCWSTAGASSATYYWLNGTTVVSHGAMVTVSEPGPFILTCVVNSSFNGSYCISTLNVSGAAVLGLIMLSLCVADLNRFEYYSHLVN